MPSLSYLEPSGSAFRIGHALGRFGAEAAHRYLIHSESWSSVMAWRESDAVRAMRALVEKRFPRILEELNGLAAGLELPPADVFVWNCRGDVWAMARDGCTTVQLPLPGGPRISHNEDGDPGFAGYCGLARVSPDDEPSFASFVYPASIPGHTFAVTQAGLAMTVNNLRTRGVIVGMPRMVLTRALLRQRSIADAVQLLRETPSAGGFHLTLGMRGDAQLVGVEFLSAGVSALSIETPSVHANHVIHPAMQEVPQVITRSSECRQERGDAMLLQAASDAGTGSRWAGENVEPLTILADRHSRTYPIYRDAPDDSDQENTMATADIRVGRDRVEWAVYERPGAAPRFRLVDDDLVQDR